MSGQFWIIRILRACVADMLIFAAHIIADCFSICAERRIASRPVQGMLQFVDDRHGSQGLHGMVAHI